MKTTPIPGRWAPGEAKFSTPAASYCRRHRGGLSGPSPRKMARKRMRKTKSFDIDMLQTPNRRHQRSHALSSSASYNELKCAIVVVRFGALTPNSHLSGLLLDSDWSASVTNDIHKLIIGTIGPRDAHRVPLRNLPFTGLASDVRTAAPAPLA